MANLYLEWCRVKDKAKGLILKGVDDESLRKLSQLEGYSWNREKDRAEFPLSAIWAILYNTPHVKLSPGARQFYEWAEQKLNRKVQSELEPDVVPETPDFLKPQWKLRPYQRESIAFAMKLERCLWGMDTRLGKTLAALAVHVMSGSKRTIVIAPKSTLYNWPAEAKKFFSDPPNVTVVDGSLSKPKKLKLIEEFEEGILVVNYETVANTMKWGKDGSKKVLVGGPLLDIQFDMAVVDEFHLIKNPDSQRGMAVRAIRPEWIIGMSGTPTPNGIHEIWSPLNYVNEEFCPDYGEFQATYCLWDVKTIKTKRKVRVKDPVTGEMRLEPELKDIPVLSGYTSRVQEIHRYLRMYMRRYKYWDVVGAGQLETYNEYPYYVGLTPAQRRAYDKVVKAKGYTYIDKQGEEQFQDSPLAVGTRLKRICASLSLIDPELPVATEKVDAVLELVRGICVPDEDGRINDAVVVMSAYPDMARLAIDQLTKAGFEVEYMLSEMKAEERDRRIRSFQEDGKGHVFVTTIGVAQVGIKLARADTLIFMDATYVPAEMLQAKRRIMDVEKERPITVYNIIAENTIEQIVWDILEAKELIISLLVDGKIPEAKVVSLFVDAIQSHLGMKVQEGQAAAS